MPFIFASFSNTYRTKTPSTANGNEGVCLQSVCSYPPWGDMNSIPYIKKISRFPTRNRLSFCVIDLLWSFSLMMCLVQGCTKPLGQFGYIVVCPEVHKEKPWSFVQHVIMQGRYLDSILS